MANQSLLSASQNLWAPFTWEDQCIEELRSNPLDSWINGTVNSHGHHIHTFDSSTWGIDISTCYDFCNTNKITFPTFHFATFAGAGTNYLLPWLALTAQLPYETGGARSSFMSFCMALGSPALVTYSLMITISNRRWVRKTFGNIRKTRCTRIVQERYRDFLPSIVAMEVALQEGQQVPLRVSQEKGWLSSLIVSPDNRDWWRRLSSSVLKTQRRITPSLVWQMLLAAIAYLFTIITSFNANFGSPVIALQIAAGSLWTWLIPVIAGWLTVGTQYRAGTIEEALRENTAHRAGASAPSQHHNHNEPGDQRGLLVRSGLNPRSSDPSMSQGLPRTTDTERLEVPSWMGISIQGDEAQAGPIYNYSRLFTFRQVSDTIAQGVSATLDNVRQGTPCLMSNESDAPSDQDSQSTLHSATQLPGRPSQTPCSWKVGDAMDYIRGDETATARYSGLLGSPVAYPPWSPARTDIWWTMCGAAIAAICVQWGTSGSSILIAYLTLTIGVGCRSASYLVYGVLGTFSWACLILSMLLSHEAMLRYQRYQALHPDTDFRLNANGPGQYKRPWVHTLICVAAIVTRLVGKLVATINAFWLIISSLLEFIGVYDNCFCMGDALGLGDRGWVLLFKNGSALVGKARGPWIGGLTLTLVVCVVSYTCFVVGCWNMEKRTED